MSNRQKAIDWLIKARKLKKDYLANRYSSGGFSQAKEEDSSPKKKEPPKGKEPPEKPEEEEEPEDDETPISKARAWLKKTKGHGQFHEGNGLAADAQLKRRKKWEGSRKKRKLKKMSLGTMAGDGTEGDGGLVE